MRAAPLSASAPRLRGVASCAPFVPAAPRPGTAPQAPAAGAAQPGQRAALVLSLAFLLIVSITSSLLVASTAQTATAAALRFRELEAGGGALRSGAAAAPGPERSLLAAHVIFRHGARTPLTTAFYQGLQWACEEEYAGAKLERRDAAGGAAPPPMVDPSDKAPKLPGGALC